MIQLKIVRNISVTYGFYAIVILTRIYHSHGYCPRGWIEHGRKCYGAFMPDGRYRDVANMYWNFCYANGGTLLQPRTEEKNQAAAKLLNSRSPLYSIRAVIGLNDRDKEGDFRWSDGTKLRDTWQNWLTEQPDDLLGEDCVEILEKGKWNDLACNGEILRTHTTLCEQQLKGTCLSGWIRHGRKCYIAFPATGYHTSVEDMEKVHCIANKGILMSTKTPEEHRIAVKLIHSVRSLNLVQGVIGLNDRSSEGIFKWSDGTKLTWENWLDGQPDNKNKNRFGSDEDCVHLRGDGKWSDISCHDDLLYSYITLCEQPIPASGNCPVDWIEHGSKCYAGFRPHRSLSLDDVKHMEKVFCIGNNGILMNPKTEEENNLALRLLNSVIANSTYHGIIRLGRLHFGRYRLSDGTFETGNWNNWAYGEPNNKERKENCVEMYPSGKWGDCPCIGMQYTHITICEKRAKAYMSTSQKPTTQEEESGPTQEAKRSGPYQRSRVFEEVSTFGENPYILAEPTKVTAAFSTSHCYSKCMNTEDCTTLNFNTKLNQCRLFTTMMTDQLQEVENVPDWILLTSTDISVKRP